MITCHFLLNNSNKYNNHKDHIRNTGAFSAEAQSALLAVTPNILNGSDLDTELAAAEEQFNQTIQ